MNFLKHCLNTAFISQYNAKKLNIKPPLIALFPYKRNEIEQAGSPTKEKEYAFLGNQIELK